MDMGRRAVPGVGSVQGRSVSGHTFVAQTAEEWCRQRDLGGWRWCRDPAAGRELLLLPILVGCSSLAETS